MRMPSGWKSVIGADRLTKGSNVGRQVKVGPLSMLLHQFVDCLRLVPTCEGERGSVHRMGQQ